MNSYFPSEQLSPFIKSYLIIESEGELVNRILPGTSLVLAIRFKGKVNFLNEGNKTALPSQVLSGLKKSVRLINYQKDSGAILIQFKEAGASAFFKTPLHELFEESISLDNFISQSKISLLEEQLAEAKDHTAKIKVIEELLLEQLYTYNEDKLVLSAVKKIHLLKGDCRIKELAETHCLSQDAFEKRFRKTIGASPKKFASIVRMKNIIGSGLKNLSYTEMAMEAGFTDQSHFNKDFKLFTGLTPTDFFKKPAFW